jgi:hypothetical protein
MNTPTPRTDGATYPADCLGQTLVTNRDLARTLERELTAAKERLRSEAMDDYASIKHLQRELATERARLDWLESDAGVDWQWSSAALTIRRAVIDAAMQEDAK